MPRAERGSIDPATATADQVDAFLERILDPSLDGFIAFARALWAEMGWDEVAPIGDMEEDILRWIAYGPEFGGPRKRAVLAYRGIGKTHMGPVAYSLWRLRRNPQTERILIPSKSMDAAMQTIKLNRSCIDAVWFLRDLSPEQGLNKSDTTKYFDVSISEPSRTPSMKAVGIDSQIPGNRASLIMPDDVETPVNVKTRESREELAESVTEFRAVATFGDKEVVYIGTYHHEDSLYLKLAEKGYMIRAWPKVYPTPEQRARIPFLAPYITDRLDDGRADAGDLTTPHRTQPVDIIDDEAEGRIFFDRQIMLMPRAGDGTEHPLRLSDLIVFPVDRDKAPISIAWGRANNKGTTSVQSRDLPCLGLDGDDLYGPIFVDKEWERYTGTKAWLDPSGRGADEHGLTIIGHLAATYFVKLCTGIQGGADLETVDKIARLLYEHRATELGYESNIDAFGTFGEMLTVAINKLACAPGENPECPEGWACSVHPVHQVGQKEVRIIETLEPVMSTHRLVVDPASLAPSANLALDYELQHQISRITHERRALTHDDRLDSLAGCIKLWQPTMRVDPAKATEQRRQDLREKRLREFWDDHPAYQNHDPRMFSAFGN